MDKLNITTTVLDKLGFSEYWDENGDWGGRTLTFTNGARFRIIEQEEKDDEMDGYGYGKSKYIAHHFYFAEWFAIPKMEGLRSHDLFFLHDMYECLLANYPQCIDEFYRICDDNNMAIYIDSYLKQTNLINN